MIPSNFLLIRGLARESGHWGEFVEKLSQQEYCKSVYPIDLPGTGIYSKISSPLSIAENAEFVVSQMRSLKLDQEKITVVSISLGSMVAIEMASRYPQYFKKVFLMNTSLAGLSPFYHRLQLKSLKNFYKIGLTKNSEDREFEILHMVSNQQDRWDQVKKEWAQIADDRPVRLQNFARQLMAASRYRIPDQKPMVDMAIFVSHADNMVDPRCSSALAEKWDIPIETHPTAGHELALDAPDWVIKQLGKYS